MTDRAIIFKVDALRRLAQVIEYDREQAAELLQRLGARFIQAVESRLADHAASDMERTACAIILDLLTPGWRDRKPGLAGHVLRRNDIKVRNWRDAVLQRDGCKCVHCGATSELHAHHIIPWASEPMLRVSLDNGVTLCQPCHVRVHHG